MRRNKSILWLSIVLLFAGCAYYPVNPKLSHFDDKNGYRFENLPATAENSDKVFVVLTFSGGGTRAAALTYSVLRQLSNTVVYIDGKPRRLLDEVDVISSVSGGSFTAAYYALYGDRIFSDFEARFLKKDIQGALKWRLFSPINWVRLASPTFSRIDMAAEYYDRYIFDYHTFGDLAKKGHRPFITINATDMSLGARFEFSQDQFDWLYSNLSGVSVARAVAASSAFPGLFCPITFRNHSHEPDYREPGWVKPALHDSENAPVRYRKALDVRSYGDSNRRPYIHLLDGGLSDNIGLRGTLRSLESTDGGWSLTQMRNMEKVQKIVIVTVNAQDESVVSWDKQKSPPGLKSVLSVVAFKPMENYSFDSMLMLKQDIDRLTQDARTRKDFEELLRKNCPDAKLPGGDRNDVQFYRINVSFDGIKDEAERNFFKSIKTSFSLPSETVDRLCNVGKKLLSESAEFQRLLHDLCQ
ncbi:MAG: hypothetical protein A2283_11590 [Lentisphaerae bacterium RIFOXYA12_FULL_48_11]|nr:MAG: hypothetical protein A2283_11590 [Lentisphaerae bacterium RIFOXYA12_FULL_48_11]